MVRNHSAVREFRYTRPGHLRCTAGYLDLAALVDVGERGRWCRDLHECDWGAGLQRDRSGPDWLPHNPPGRGGEHVMLGAFVTGDGYAPMDPNGYGIECIAVCRKP